MLTTNLFLQSACLHTPFHGSPTATHLAHISQLEPPKIIPSRKEPQDVPDKLVGIERRVYGYVDVQAQETVKSGA